MSAYTYLVRHAPYGFEEPAPLRQMARLTAELLLRRIESPQEEEGRRTHYRLSGELIVRGSTARPHVKSKKPSNGKLSTND